MAADRVQMFKQRLRRRSVCRMGSAKCRLMGELAALNRPSFPSISPHHSTISMANPNRKRRFPFSIDSILSTKTSKRGECSAGQIHWALQRAQIRLEGASLWRRFDALGTEMIVTRSGRRMFPTLQCSVRGLEPGESYSLMVDFQCTDRKRYRYSFHQSKWVVAGGGEAEFPARMHVHPESPANGAHWERQAVITFDKVKLTNNPLDQNGHAIVNSMHRYQPRFHLVLNQKENLSTDERELTALKRKTFAFAETIFMAVTAYQNHRITELKIESNPFAKGFRECDLLSTDQHHHPQQPVNLASAALFNSVGSSTLNWLLSTAGAPSLLMAANTFIGAETKANQQEERRKKRRSNEEEEGGEAPLDGGR